MIACNCSLYIALLVLVVKSLAMRKKSIRDFIFSVLDSYVKPQAAQTLNTINTWHYAVGDCITILAVCKTMYENASKITVNAMFKK